MLDSKKSIALVLFALWISLVYDKFCQGGPMAGFFLLTIVGFFVAIGEQSWSIIKRLQIIIPALAAMIVLDQIMGPALEKELTGLHLHATKPFEGYAAEKSAHYFGMLRCIALVILNAGALIAWWAILFPKKRKELFFRLKILFLIKFYREKNALAAVITATIVSVFPEAMGYGPIAGGTVWIIVCAAAYWLLSGGIKPIPRVLTVFILVLGMTLFSGPGLARLVERSTALQEASLTKDSCRKAELLRGSGFSEGLAGSKLTNELAIASLKTMSAALCLTAVQFLATVYLIDRALYGRKGHKRIL